MRNLTFKGLLEKYIKGLSYAGTVDIRKLTSEVMSGNYRLRAPLLLYAVTHGKTDLLKSCLLKEEAPEGLLTMLTHLEGSNLEELLEDGTLPEEYRKVWNSFKVRKNQPETEDALKAAMRNKILHLQKTKNCSNYRLYKDLNLNPGNINSWLKNGDGSKVSYHTAERIITYVMQY